MFLLDKYTTPSQSYLGLSSLVLDVLRNNKFAIDQLWRKFKKKYISSKKLKNPPSVLKVFVYFKFYAYVRYDKLQRKWRNL